MTKLGFELPNVRVYQIHFLLPIIRKDGQRQEGSFWNLEKKRLFFTFSMYRVTANFLHKEH